MVLTMTHPVSPLPIGVKSFLLSIRISGFV